MRVHNFYTDLLMSLCYYLDRVTNNNIKNFQFNIGSRSFSLSYDPNYELPSAYVTYNNTTHTNARPHSFLHSFSNYNQINVLYNRDRNLLLKIQEDHFNVSIDVKINLDSQFQAIDLKHNIESKIPIGKPLQIYRFTSFFELDNTFINPYLFDPINNVIDNLFFRHNQILNSFSYYFSVSYEPLVKLDTINFDGLDINQSTYSLDLNFDIAIQIPTRLLFSPFTRSSPDEYKQIKYDKLQVPITNDKNILPIEFLLEVDGVYKKIIAFSNLTDTIHEYIDENLEFKYQYILGSSIEFGDVSNSSLYKASVSITSGNEENKYGQINGANISGNIKNVVIEDNTFSADFEGDFEGVVKSFRIEDALYEFRYRKHNIKNIKIKNPEIKIIDYRILIPNSIFEVIKTFRIPNAEIDFEFTKIFPDVELNKKGEFLLKEYNMFGKIDKESSKISFDKYEFDYKLLTIEPVLKFFPVRGPGAIDDISIDFSMDSSAISPITPIVLNNYSSENYNLVLDNLIYTLIEDSNRYIIEIPLPFYNKSIPKEYSLFFTGCGTTVDQNNVNLILDRINSIYSKLVFTTHEGFFKDHFSHVSKLYPLFFSMPRS